MRIIVAATIAGVFDVAAGLDACVVNHGENTLCSDAIVDGIAQGPSSMVGPWIGRVNQRLRRWWGASGPSGAFSRFGSPLLARFGWRWFIWAGLVAALALFLDFVPLFDLLGYDFSFAVGLAVALAAVDVGCGVVAATRRHAARSPDVFGLAMLAAVGAVGLLVLPLALSLLNALRVRNCNLTSGFGFFLLLPVSTAIYASGVGVLAALVWPRRGRLLAFAAPITSILWTLARLYFDPPVFAYDPFGGYFPGPIYDEALRPSSTFVAFRLCNMVWLAAGLSVAWAAAAGTPSPTGGALRLTADARRWRRWPTVVGGVLVAGGLVLFSAEARLGFHLDRQELTRILDGERRSPRVILRYAAASAPAPADLDLLMEDLDFRYDQLRKTFQVEPDRAITVYQFANADEKKALVGAGATLFAKPWTREVFVQGEAFPSHRLRHEMAHVFAASFGDPLFGVAFRLRWKGPIPVPRLASGLIEGIAEAADFTDPGGGSTTHQEAAALIADGRAMPLGDLMGAGFSTQSGPRAYTLAGSFTRFLLDTRGGEKLKQIYRSAGDFPAVYGASLESLESEWRKFLSTQSLSAEQRARAREQFRRPAIFKKVCAREQAARIVQARSLLAGDPKRAIGLLEEACQDDPAEPNLQLELAQSLATSGNATRALQVLGLLARDADLTAPVRARASGLVATIQFHLGDFENARAALREVLGAATDEGERRQATAKLRALDDEPARRTLGRALFGNDVNGTLDPVLAFFLLSEFARLHPGEALGPYLVGRQLAFRDPRAAAPFLRVACEGTSDAPGEAQALTADFRRECLRMTMQTAFRSGDLVRSAAAARSLANEATEDAERLRAADFLARITWRQAKQ